MGVVGGTAKCGGDGGENGEETCLWQLRQLHPHQDLGRWAERAVRVEGLQLPRGFRIRQSVQGISQPKVSEGAGSEMPFLPPRMPLESTQHI